MPAGVARKLGSGSELPRSAQFAALLGPEPEFSGLLAVVEGLGPVPLSDSEYLAAAEPLVAEVVGSETVAVAVVPAVVPVEAAAAGPAGPVEPVGLAVVVLAGLAEPAVAAAYCGDVVSGPDAG